MALIASSTLSSISGSIGGTTYARNRGGAYARNRTVPINPNSSAQTRARSSLSARSGQWSTVLTAGQRAAWAAYAESQTVLNRLGESITLTGQQAYVRSNTLLSLAGETLVTTPPVINPPAISIGQAVQASYNAGTPQVALQLLQNVSGMMLCFCGPSQSPGALSLKVPFRYFGFMDMDGDNAVVALAGAGARVFSVGERMAWRFVLVTPTGAVSNELLCRGVAVA